MQDKSKLNPRHMSVATAAVRAILLQEPFSEEREKYCSLCLENIRQNKSCVQSISLLNYLLDSFENRNSFIQTNESTVFCLCENNFSLVPEKLLYYHKEYHGLIDVLIKNLEIYMNEVKGAKATMKDNAKIENFEEYVKI